MFTGIGIAIVLGCVVGGYLLAKGNLAILFQPAEMIIIFGAAIGNFVISSPPKVLKATLGSISKLFGGKAYARQDYEEVLLLLNEIFFKIRKEGLVSIESDIEDPEKSEIFKKYTNFLKDHHALAFLADTLRTLTIMDIDAHELANLLDYEIDAHHEEALIPSGAIANVADALPGLGIVAAVLGVVITMGHLDQPPEVLGHHIGAALVGTFLGVLMCYGFVGPMAKNLENSASEGREYLNVIKVALISFVNSPSPQMAVEFGRRVVPQELRPSFLELEQLIKQSKK
ncbi:MAG: flagellar motor stator protein MotA [Syntrophobacteraceae bacterium]|jgi:chemotaxis protein MotA|nr:flagellar motor stator protein MotA [Syntrophobacteraceae bacterium]